MNKKPNNLKVYKTELRKEARARREIIDPVEKAKKDKQIFKQLAGMSLFRNAPTVFTYVSTAIEVDTWAIMDLSFTKEKKVAVPRCIKGSRDMDFYLINSTDELEVGSYGLLEPVVNSKKLAISDENSFCVMPAMCCDKRGFRLGYGGGYYDRFLNNFNGIKAIIIYESFLIDNIWQGKFDISADFIITEKMIIDCRQPL